MGQIPDWIVLIGMIFGLPIYVYLLIRAYTSAITRSICEVILEFKKKEPKQQTIKS